MDPIQALLLQNNQQGNGFPANSRYHRVDTQVHQSKNQGEIRYLERRFVPRASDLTTLQQHTVKQGERLDNITAQYLNDPELFWQVCDANKVMHPLEITERTGRLIRITMPQGL
ncbi:MAG: LysM domain-containing protein [Bacteroidota bacterium]